MSLPIPLIVPTLLAFTLQALKEEGSTKESEVAFARVLALDEPGQPSLHAMRVIAQVSEWCGRGGGGDGYHKNEGPIPIHTFRCVNRRVTTWEPSASSTRPSAPERRTRWESGEGSAGGELDEKARQCRSIK